uniref:Non canonical pyrimidine nucleotidase, YjjG family n=1 Tax=Orpinomyces joyonii TaxID=48250 RepID=A0A2S1TZ02_9FUNG|nr:non canonical pyrimidine nucleotidase, YjjG family [Orpinomyces joyonii]
MHHNFLFDLDQTLLNFHASEYIGLKKIIESNGQTFTDELYQYFKKRNKELWMEYEKENITKNQLFETRFRLLFEKCNVDTSNMDLLKINGEFIKIMSQNGVLMKGALEFLKKLRNDIPNSKIIIITNGAKLNAEGRIESTGLNAYYDDIFISEVIGVNKPSIEFFNIVLNAINEPKESCIVIGDSLTSDMLGAKNAGLTSCWFIPEEANDIDKNMKEYDINYKASSFDELYDVLKKWANLSM